MAILKMAVPLLLFLMIGGGLSACAPQGASVENDLPEQTLRIVNALRDELKHSERNIARWTNLSPDQMLIESNNTEFRLQRTLRDLRLTSSVAALLPLGAEPRSVDNVWGLLLLDRPPAVSRNVCNIFYAAFPAVRDPMREAGVVLRPTYWPDQRPADELPTRTNCSDLVQNYDRIWARAVLNQLKLDLPRGPVLVAFGPKASTPGQLATVVLDLSSWPMSELPLAFAIWTRTISQNPSEWREMDLAERLRLRLRNFLIAHGDTLFEFVNLSGFMKRARADPPRDAQEQEPRDVEIVFD